MLFIIDKSKDTIQDSSQGTVKLLWISLYDLAAAFSTILFYSNIIST